MRMLDEEMVLARVFCGGSDRWHHQPLYQRVLRPGGKLVVPTYCHAHPGQRRFDLDGLVEAVGQAGFVVLAGELVPGVLPIGFVLATVARGAYSE